MPVSRAATRQRLLAGASAVVLAMHVAPALACTYSGNDQTISTTDSGCVGWTSGNFSITSTGTISSSSLAVSITGSNGTGTLTNSGSINGTFDGIYNGGTIGALINQSGATISSNSHGIYTTGTIGTLSNSGVISGKYPGIYNSGSIATLTNTGTISSQSNDGIINSGAHIGTLTNNGVISGKLGIYDFGSTIATLVNSGTISGGAYGIDILTHLTIYGSIGTLINTGTIKGAPAINIGTLSTLGGITNSGLIAGSITNAGTGVLTIAGGSGPTFGTLTGSSGSIGSTDEGTITNINSNLAFGSGNLLLNDTVNVGSNTVTNSGATLSIVNTIGVTGTYAQSAGTLQFSSGGELSITGAASITGGTIGLDSAGNYLVGTSQTLVSASASSTYSGATLSTPTGSAATGAASGNNYVATFNNDYVGGSLSNIPNTGVLSGAATMVYVASTGSLGSLTNSGTISGTAIGIDNLGSIGAVTNTGTISAPTAIDNAGTIGPITNSGLIAGSIVNTAAQDLTINGASGTGFGTLTGSSGSIGSSDEGTITNTSSNLAFGSGNLLLNDTVNVGSNTVTNSGATLSIVNTIGVTGTYAQSAGTLQFGSGGALSITGAASITGGTIGLGSSTGNYLAGTGQTLISASASSTYSGATLSLPTGLAATGAASGNNYVATFNNDYVGASLSSISNTGALSGAATMVHVASTGSLGSLTNSGTISGSAYGVNNLGSIGAVTNSGTISGPTAVKNSGTLGPVTNSGLIAGNIVNTAAQDLTIAGGSGSTFGTLTGSSGSIGSSDEGTITNTASNLAFSSGNLLLNDTVNVGSNTVTNSGATLSIVNTIGVTGTYAQSAGTLQFSSGGELSITGAASITGGTIGLGSATGNYSVGDTLTLVSASASSTYSGVTFGMPTGLAATGAASGNNYVATFTDDYVGASQPSISNTGVLSGAATMVHVAATGSLSSLTNSGTISGTAIGVNNLGSIGAVTNTGTISAPTAIDNAGTIGPITNSGLIAGNIVNTAAQDLTINGASGTGFGTLTGSSGSIGSSDEGTITNTASNLAFGSGNLLLNDTVNVASFTVANSGAALSIVNTIGVTGTYAQSAGTLQFGSGGALSITGAASITSGTIGFGSSTGNYLAGTSQTLVSATASSTYRAVTLNVIPTGLAASPTVSGNNYVATVNNDYVGGNLSSISNTGVLSGAATMVYVAATGSLGSLTNSGTISGTAVGVNNLGSIGAVTNSGTISAPIAIDNAGTLGPITNSGLIAGNIVNTAAQDLTINGGTSYGTLTGSSGAITSAGEGTITNTASNLAFGSGNLLLNDTVNVGTNSVIASGATIAVANLVAITGAWQQSGGGLVAQAASSSSYGYLAVSGNATVANASVVIQGSGLASGNSFTIVQSGATGSYSGDTASVIGTSGLTATVQSVGNNLVVTLASPSSGSSSGSTFTAKGDAAGGVAAPLGATLDVINGSGSSTAVAFQNQVLVPLALLPSSQQGETIKELAPVQNSFQVIDVGAMTVLNAVEQHQQLAMAYNPSTGEAAGSDTLDSTLWAQMLGGGSERDSNAEAAGYRSSDYGLTAGADHLFTPDLLGGVALSWLRAWTRGTGTSSGQSSTMDSYQLTFYGTYRMGRAFLDGQLGAGWNHFDQNRSIDFLNETASAGYDGQQYLASALAGYDIGVGGPGNMTVTPLAGLRWLRAHTDSYTENGAGAADLSVNGQTTDAVTQELGFRTSWSFQTGLGTIQPELKAEWLHDYTNGAIATSGVIGGQTFTTTTPRTAADGARIGVAATFIASDSLSFRAEYDGELRSGYQSHTGLIKALWQF